MTELERATAATPAPPPTGPREASGQADAEAQRAGRARRIRRVLLVVLGLNLVVAGLKIGFGLLSGSVAMTADGFQSLLDGVANVVGLVGIAIAARPPDREHHYGHERYETLASMAIAGLMTLGVIEIVQSAWEQLRGNDAPEVTWVSFAVLGATMAVNASVSVWERREGRRLGSDLLRADAKHTATDILVSAAVLVGLAGVAVGLEWADAAVSLLVAGTIAWAAWTILRDASLVLTDATVADPHAMMAAVLAAPGVVTAHNLRARAMGGRLWVEVHVTVDPEMSVREAHEVATAVEECIRERVDAATQVIVHVEPAEPPHTRPDPLFGDALAGSDGERGRGSPPSAE